MFSPSWTMTRTCPGRVVHRFTYTRYFQFYSGGILTSSSCGTDLDHGVLIIGYGIEAGQKYWLVKNSWSNTWGENGYVRIARTDSTNDSGICGISMDPSFPIV
jgi:C1A family cysteine protease